MKRLSWLLLVALVAATLLAARNLTVQTVSPPDTQWIETNVTPKTHSASPAYTQAPAENEALAAILAAEFLLSPVDLYTHLPLIRH